MLRARTGVLVLVSLLLVLPWGSTGAQEAASVAPLLSTNFDSASDWALSGLWAADATPASSTSGSKCLNYNNGTSFHTGSRTTGAARSPSLSAPMWAEYTMIFRCNYQTETTGTTYDKRSVKAYRNGQVAVTSTLASSGTAPSAGLCGAMGVWHNHSMRIPAAASAGSGTLQVEFVFDSIDGYDNNHAGWFVDDLTIYASGLIPPTGDDHGNTPQTATYVGATGPQAGRIETAGDVDYFKMQLPMASGMGGGPIPTYRFTVWTSDLSSTMDTTVTVYQGTTTTRVGYNDDFSGMGLASKVTWNSTLNGQTYSIRVAHYSSSGTGSYKINVRWDVVPADDHGNTAGTATVLSFGVPATGKIDPAGDVDFFRFTMPDEPMATIMPIGGGLPNYPLRRINITTNSESTGSTDTVIYLLDSLGNQVAWNDDAGPGAYWSEIEVSLREDGKTYYVKVKHYSSSMTGPYTLTVGTVLQ